VRWVEPLIGVLVIWAALLDLFLTVLYARAGAGYISDHVARATWVFFTWVSRLFGRNRARILSLGGPAILVMLVATWALMLTLGAALIMHPYLGTAIKANSGPTETNFLVALYAGGSSMSLVGSSDYSPKTTGFRIVYLINSMMGMSVMSLALTYVMQIYNALQRRNAIGLNLDLMSGGTGDAALLLKGLGPRGKFESGTSNLAQLAESMGNLREAHEFYPVLFYFRFASPRYAVSRMALLAFDLVSLIRSAIGGDDNQWLKESASVTQLWNASMILVKTLESTFLPQDGSHEQDDREDRSRWFERYDAAVETLRAAGIEVRAGDGADAYVAQRSEWQGHVRELASYMQFTMPEVDPVTEDDQRRQQFRPTHDGHRIR